MAYHIYSASWPMQKRALWCKVVVLSCLTEISTIWRFARSITSRQRWLNKYFIFISKNLLVPCSMENRVHGQALSAKMSSLWGKYNMNIQQEFRRAQLTPRDNLRDQINFSWSFFVKLLGNFLDFIRKKSWLASTPIIASDTKHLFCWLHYRDCIKLHLNGNLSNGTLICYINGHFQSSWATIDRGVSYGIYDM